MALTVKIGEKAIEGEPEAPKGPPVKIKLNIRKTIDGNLLIFDHPDIDITVVPAKRKIIVFPKEKISDKTYDIQDKFFNFLARRGVVSLGSVHGGNIYGSLEAVYPEVDDPSSLETSLYVISKFIEEESKYFNLDKEFDDEFERSLTEPDEDDSTELGEVPHSDQRGAIRPGYVYSPYGISSIYRYE
tara:strand:+ start:197 stop:757 length:561 start_codon:yes stop_codon:yes gene_type:complete